MSLASDHPSGGAEGMQQQPAGSAEQLQAFVPTPEAIATYLEDMHAEEVAEQLKSVEGRQQVHMQLAEHAEAIRTADPNFNLEELSSQLDLVGETLHGKQRFLQEIQSPERKGVLRRAWKTIKKFPKKHPIVTTLLVLALAAGGVAAGFYYTGNWELFLTQVGLDKIVGGAEAAKELAPLTPSTPALPGGGVMDVPPPTPPPGASPTPYF